MANFLSRRDYDFVGKRKTAAIFSFIMVMASIALFVFRGPTWGIDFTGGTEVHIQFDEGVEIADVRSAVQIEDLGQEVSVQSMGGDDNREYSVRIQNPEAGTEGIQQQVESVLKENFGEDWITMSSLDAQVGARLKVVYSGPSKSEADIKNALKPIEGAEYENINEANTFFVSLPGQVSKILEGIKANIATSFKPLQTDSVGPKVGGELRRQGLVSILFTLGLVLVYVAFRFNFAFAPGAVLALFHDVTIVVGIFIVLDMCGWVHEFNLPMIGALLTIIGYSLNDTIVIYDRIRENMSRYRRKDMPNLINDSVNETLSRTIATSVTTLMAMIAFLLLGGPVIQTFALAIFLGVIFGTYSTVFVASPTILIMQDLQPTLNKIFSPFQSAPTEEGELSASENRRRERDNKRLSS